MGKKSFMSFMRKAGVLFIICLLSSSTFALAAHVSKQRSTGNVRTCNNTWFVPDDFPTIKAAVENASDGDKIIVREGTYYENNITIENKTLTVQGVYENGIHKTTIDGSNQDVFIIKNIRKEKKVCIKNFYIRNAYDGIKLLNWVSNSSLLDNKIQCTHAGISMERYTDNVIKNNMILCHSARWGIKGEVGWWNNITGNTILLDDTTYGILLTDSEHNTVEYNQITITNRSASIKWDTIGIALKNSFYDKVSNNVIQPSNTNSWMKGTEGIWIKYTEDIKIISNTVDHLENGFNIRNNPGVISRRPTIKDNEIKNNHIGIYFYYSSVNFNKKKLLEENVFQNNDQDIYIEKKRSRTQKYILNIIMMILNQIKTTKNLIFCKQVFPRL